MIKKEKSAQKHQIISEYLTGEESYVSLGEKYGVNPRTIQTWVRAFRLKEPLSEELSLVEPEPDIKLLKRKLQQAELKNELLTEILRLSEEQTGINFIKKFGSGQ